MSIRNWLIPVAVATQMLVGSALAGPYSDAEARLNAAYGDYRTALFQTNQKNRDATNASLASFREKWRALSAAWRLTPPPQYADDPQLSATLDTVSQAAEEATRLAASGELGQSHDVLERIRDAIGLLRARNGILSFSDRMNAYHEVMEHLLEAADPSPAEVMEQAAVLAYLAKSIGDNRPPAADKAAFDAAFQTLETSVRALQAAARSGDRAAVETARKALKPPYSRMFLRFG